MESLHKKNDENQVNSEEVLNTVNRLNIYQRRSLCYRTPYFVFFKIKPVHLRFEFALFFKIVIKITCSTDLGNHSGIIRYQDT